MSTKKDFEQEMIGSDEDLMAKDSEGKSLSRRKFTRNALVGSAVLLTLSNRSAWGDKLVVCASTNLLISYGAGRASAFTAEQLDEINTFERYLDQAKKEPENINGDTCYEVNLPNDSSNDINNIIY